MTTNDRYYRGKEAERAAADYLSTVGMEILDKNYRCPRGEIDLIAKDGRTVVFVEVRSRRSEGFGSPEESITHSKRSRLIRVAQRYIKEHRLYGCVARFDVVAVRWDGDNPQINWMINAFEAGR